ncbi:MAG: hypothetical protein OXB92_15695 [Acidimicrobiaceae bacterium]|nr:hypothetical protein [Acidimicrobiia bacterium]MCY4495288.1 hypothetical protein [Acidimicrobiaceae bacterium]
MDVVVALHAAAALLLMVAGLAKVLRPVPTAELLASVGLPEVPAAVAAMGVVESVVGVLALVVGGPLLAAATGTLYVGFIVVVGRALATGAESCGCFGRVDSPPSWIHVVGNAVFAVASFVAAAGRTPAQVMAEGPAFGIGFVLAAGVLAGLALVAFTAVPEALAARGVSSPQASVRINNERRSR